MKMTKYLILSFGLFIGTQALAKTAFNGPVRCTVESTKESAVTSYTRKVISSGGYWYSEWSTWFGSNFGESKGFLGLGPVAEFRQQHPDRNPFMVLGEAEVGRPITRIAVTLWASARQSHPGDFPIWGQVINRKLYPYHNFCLNSVCDKETTHLPSFIPDPIFTASVLKTYGGSITFAVPVMDQNGKNVIFDRITCEGKDFIEVP